MTSTQATNEQLIKDLWRAVNDLKWEEAATLLHQDFVAEWPQSQELFRGPVNYLTMNRKYPGKHKIEIKSITSAGNNIISVIHITTNENEKLFAVSFFEVSGGKILRATEYFADTYPAPEWRAQWVERSTL